MLGIIENKFIIGRDEFYPFSAEMHYFRVEKRYWSICFERIKKAGFRIISTYVPWNLHEIRPGDFDFRGVSGPEKDLIVFLELCREFGFKVILKPGPWIRAEWFNGGLPQYIFTDEAVVSRDYKGELVMAKNGPGMTENYQPCYLHPKYLGHVKRYLGGLVEVIQNYIFPKGPVFILQLDEELSFGGNTSPFAVDYNNYIITEYYHKFLEEKYQTSDKLPIAYGKKVKHFSEVEPPTSVETKKPEDLVKYFNWLEFKGQILSKYIQALRERLEGLGVGCLFSVNLPWTDDFGLPADWSALQGEKMLIGMQVPDPRDYCRLGRNLRYLTNKTGFCWTPQLFGGRAIEGAGKAASDQKTDFAANTRFHRYLLVSSLAAGLKGINHYMFVGRDHWQGSPLGRDGTVNDNYEVIRKASAAMEQISINTAKPLSKIGISYHKPYLIQHHLGMTGQFSYIYDLIGQTLNPLGQDLMNLKFDYGVSDIDSDNGLDDKDLYFIGVAEYMSVKSQQRILDAVEKGKTVVLIGLMPKFDEEMNTCKILTKGLGFSTVADWAPSNITWEKTAFRAIRYGSISSKGSEKVLVKSGTKVLGVYKKVGNGAAYLFTFDISPKFDPGKLSLLQYILSSQKITSPVATSDPNVDLIAHVNDKGLILYLINTDTTFTAPHSDFAKKVVIAVDLASIGFKQAKVKMQDVLEDLTYDLTSRELKEGIVFSVGYYDARIFFIPRK
jgi:beta-galactosidase